MEEQKARTKCEVYKRIVGYLRPVEQCNPGKKAELGDRLVYKETSVETPKRF